ncbi:hypothetical protein [Methanosarcina sp. 2.H.T.1A.15]|uniref:hypothetical protein n=1 Tax=Methanosarcina sp. 2.H.T.1A.15 TaxID=1483596 RepID=UPI000621CE92|nr:hypothetical protein [Methanosarcina sp. 2.H.T.1A.15]KKG21311.1 hypothetical protein EO97_12990 [Methanosarcina sp. 2.H.T.1A.15]
MTINSTNGSDKEEISAASRDDEKNKKRGADKRALFERYEKQLKNLDSELVTSDDEIALQEAFRYAKEVMGPEELVEWFISLAEPFYRSATWQVLLPMYEAVSYTHLTLPTKRIV